ncbi:hypothetical protein AMJ52_08305 [candidate division TA06 bacterium DG_78]|uniref:DUF4382 domain-containing protein n=1 Tax=candidate division TA06 bacterium DG_78 TaxID=1703772 RepID=A0A0S7YAM4_UNCT6|nr:MAG: hypothetical protein AMJ52_08305 [candidate division TA06 bacterium DG_78]
MKKIGALFALIIVINCAGNATVEFGMNDRGLLRGTLGDFVVYVSKIELPEDNIYTTVWDGSSVIEVSVTDDDFVTITEHYIEVPPGSYEQVRVTIDSLYYVQEQISEVLVGATLQFIATAISDVVIEEGDELQLVINIVSDNWFDAESLMIRPGHEAFEGARLQVHHEY